MPQWIKKKKGFITTYVLVFGFAFLILLGGLLNFIIFQVRQADRELAFEQTLHIAEAGLNRYRWYLVHKYQELLEGIEVGCPPSVCQDCEPCEYQYSLPGEGVIGRYKLDVQEHIPCGMTTSIAVTALAWTIQFPEIERKISVKFIRPTVAEFSYILNHNVWAGADREIKGPYHSNGGIRMDGENNSIVASEQEEWVCTASYGCDSCPSVCHYVSGEGCVCPGVFTTANGQEELFRQGAGHFDFEGITMDFARIKQLTQPPPEGEGQGVYLPPSERKGYHVILNQKEVEVYRITELSRVQAYSLEEDTHWEYSIISEEEPATNYLLGDCGLIFVEDDVWVEGEVDGKITLISADLIHAGEETDVWLRNDIVYSDRDGSDGFVLASQHNVLITPDSPDYLELHGAYIAQNGHFGRNHYSSWSYPQYAKKEKLEIYGSIVSNGRVGTKWSSGGIWVSGYRNRENIYDPKLGSSPPPFLPWLSDEFKLRVWEEVR